MKKFQEPNESLGSLSVTALSPPFDTSLFSARFTGFPGKSRAAADKGQPAPGANRILIHRGPSCKVDPVKRTGFYISAWFSKISRQLERARADVPAENEKTNAIHPPPSFFFRRSRSVRPGFHDSARFIVKRARSLIERRTDSAGESTGEATARAGARRLESRATTPISGQSRPVLIAVSQLTPWPRRSSFSSRSISSGRIYRLPR